MAEWMDLTDVPPESAHTVAHAVAPRPDLWHAPDGESTESEVSELVGALVRALQPELVVETGTAYGYTTLEIAKALLANGHGHCVSLEVDHDRLVAAAQLLANHEISPDVVELREQSSLDYTPPRAIGFAWFDSLYELRAMEFRRYRELGVLPAGTIVGFHDWTSGIRRHYLDVRNEIRKLEEDGLLTPVFLPTPRGVAIAQVR